MNNEKLNARDLLVIASSQWASAKDIMVIGSVGRNKAYAIRNEIIADYYDGDQRVYYKYKKKWFYTLLCRLHI